VRQLTITAEKSGDTVRALLKQSFGMADGLLSHLKFVPGAVQVNGNPARLLHRLTAGDLVTVTIEDRPSSPIPAAAVPLDILWEDEDLLVVNKPAGMAVHGGCGGCPTLANALAAYWGEETPFHPVNRLDRGTSGVMAVAKGRYIHDALRRVLHTDDFRRDYLALTVGVPHPTAGVIDRPIDPALRAVSDGGKPSVTAYEMLAQGGGVALVHVTPATGRTHQIRIHLASIGTPLLGDTRYGTASPLIHRPALHSRSLALRHPVTGEWVCARAPLPPDMAALAQSLEEDGRL
jgi:23S rRNA pseudouridine1911/1915/1917 synthase